MAKIIVEGKYADGSPWPLYQATMSEPDAEGRLEWTCICGDRSDRPRPPEDAIADAEIHVDIKCTG